MKGLLLKDLYQTWKNYKPYFLIVIFFSVISIWGNENAFFIAYPFFFMGMIPVGLISLDEGSKWEVFCGTLPCTKAAVVSGKYLIGLLAALPALALMLGAQLLRMSLAGAWNGAELVGLLSVCLILALLIQTITLPMAFWLGSTKGRIFQLAALAVFFGGTAVVGTVWSGTQPAFLRSGAAPWAVALAVLGLYALSWVVSVRVYEKWEVQ